MCPFGCSLVIDSTLDTELNFIYTMDILEDDETLTNIDEDDEETNEELHDYIDSNTQVKHSKYLETKQQMDSFTKLMLLINY